MKVDLSLFVGLLIASAAVAKGDDLKDLTARAETGDAVAQLELGERYSKGDGVGRDPTLATQWILKAAEQGDARAQFVLGQRYLNGEGVPRNPEEAVKWLAKSAVQKSIDAQMALGRIYISGKVVKRNSFEAAKWFKMSAEQGNAAAQCQLGRMHMTGGGVSQDDVEAYKWSSLAAVQDDFAAKKILVFLEQRMAPEQIAEGRKRAADWLNGSTQPKPSDLPENPPEVLPTELPAGPE